MELNNLLQTFSKKDSDTKKYLAIEVGPQYVKSACWEIVGIKPGVVQIGSVEEYSSGDEDSLLTAVDASISKACEGIEPEPSEVIFSLPETWVERSSIADAKKPLLRKITKKLDLKPVGFVVTVEALIHYLKIKQGAPFTGILLGVNDTEILVTLVNSGQIIDSQSAGRSDDLSSDVEEGIARFSDTDSLPSNLLLYDGLSDLEEQKQTLLSYNWQERLPFLHIPKIDHFSPDETITAVAVAGGAEVIKSLQVSSKGAVTPAPDADADFDTPDQPDQAEAEPAAATGKPEEIPDLSQEFGFTKPVASDNLKPAPDGPKINDISKDDPPKDFEPDPLDSFDEDDYDGIEPDVPDTGRVKRANPLSFIAGFLGRLKPAPTRFSKLALIFMILIILLVPIGAFAAYWFLPTATVTVALKPNVIKRDITFTLDPALDQLDLASSTLPARLSQSEVTAQASVPATGTKLVGEKASGTVTLYNRTDSVKEFATGTKLTGPDSLIYTINQDVQIASASSKENPDLTITIQPAQVEVAITAFTIGPEYNMGSGTEFSVANFDKSSFVARANTDISGGTSREITAVSDDDIQALTDQVMLDIQTKASAQFNDAGDDLIGAIVLTEDQEALSQNYSAQIGDEADQVNLSSTLTVSAMTYKKSDLALLIQQAVVNTAPEGYQFQDAGSTIKVTQTETNEDDSITVTASAQALFLPVLDATDIANNLKGRFPAVTDSYFATLPNFSRVVIHIQPEFLPPQIKTFPRVADNITVEFELQEE